MEILIRNGMRVLVDDDRYDLVASYHWQPRRSRGGNTYFYSESQRNGLRTYLSMHRLIMGATAGQVVDHVNGDRLDNRRANLRFATPSQNQANRHRPSKAASPYRGVAVARRSFWPEDRWRASITVNRRCWYLGYFRSQEAAARAYDAAARHYFGEFASPNFPEVVP